MHRQQFTPLYRIETPTLPFSEQNGVYFDEQLAGQWFDLYLRGALAQANRARLYSERYNAPAQLAIGIVTTNELANYHASNHPVASKMAHFSNDYIIPRDGSVRITEADIDQALRDRDDKQIYRIAKQIIRGEIGRRSIFDKLSRKFSSTIS